MTRQDAERATKDAAVVGLLALGISVILTFVYASGAGFGHVSLWNWLDLAILGGLTFGIYKQNRTAALTMLIYFLGSKLVFWVGEQALIGVPIALILAYFFWRGYQGATAIAKEDFAEEGQIQLA